MQSHGLVDQKPCCKGATTALVVTRPIPELWPQTPGCTGDACAVRWRRPLPAARRRRQRQRCAQCACALAKAVAVFGSGPAVLRGAGAAMAQPGKLLKEQKYDRQLR